MYFVGFLETTVRNILGDMANHHNIVPKATSQSLSQGFPSLDNRVVRNTYALAHFSRHYLQIICIIYHLGSTGSSMFNGDLTYRNRASVKVPGVASRYVTRDR